MRMSVYPKHSEGRPVKAPANSLNPKKLIKYPAGIFVLLALRHEGSEHREPRDPSANMLIHKDLTSY